MIIETAVISRRSGEIYKRTRGIGCWSLWCLRKGKLWISSGSTVKKQKDASGDCISAPALILIRSNVELMAEAKQPTQETHIYFVPKEEWVPFLQWSEIIPGCQVLILENYSQIIFDVATEIIHYSGKHDPTHSYLALNSLEKLFLLVDRINPNTCSLWDWDDRIKTAVRYLDHNLDKLVHVEELAKAVGMSPSHLAHLFKNQTGYSPVRFHLLLRIKRARQLLLASNKKIKEIATEIGFRNPYHFSTSFRNVVGCSPIEYRHNPIPYNTMNLDRVGIETME